MNWEQRFWRKVLIGDGCWEWTGSRTQGYGYTGTPGPGGSRRAARSCYELLVGPIPDGLTIDHLCRNKGCVNPAHLEAVTMAENIRRADNANGLKTHCKRGHELTPENIYVRPSKPNERECRTCAAERESRRGYRVRPSRANGLWRKYVR